LTLDPQDVHSPIPRGAPCRQWDGADSDDGIRHKNEALWSVESDGDLQDMDA
jgi:hypothetical protein